MSTEPKITRALIARTIRRSIEGGERAVMDPAPLFAFLERHPIGETVRRVKADPRRSGSKRASWSQKCTPIRS